MLLCAFALNALILFCYGTFSPLEFRDFVNKQVLIHSLTIPTFATKHAIRAPMLVRSDCIAKQTNKNVKIKLLMFSDSISRFMVDEWCSVHRSGKLQKWGDFKYDNTGALAAQVCLKGNIIMGFVHIFASDLIGPYVYNNNKTICNDAEDPNADTKLRIKHAIELFSVKFGSPNFVLFRSDLWDLVQLPESEHRNDQYTELIMHYIDNYNANIAQIQTLLPWTYIGTHTIPTPVWGGYLFQRYENFLRYLSITKENFFLFDFQQLTNTGVDVKINLRDNHHPTVDKTVMFANLMLTVMEEYLNVTC